MNLTDKVAIPASINAGLNPANNSFMLNLLGRPRATFTTDCAPITNPTLAKHIVSRVVGPIKVTGLDAVLDELDKVFAEIKQVNPAAYASIGTAGMLCCRLVRGSKTSISNHSWGTAVDLTMAHILDERGDDRVQVGLTQIAPIFNKYLFYWGAGFPTEDGMHFEASIQLLNKLKAAGKLP